jgi:DNA mismatch repair protein MutS2
LDKKALNTLEFPKILDRLADFTSFSASRELALALEPTTSHNTALTALRLQKESSEATRLLKLRPNVTIGGARDVRAAARHAGLGGVLEPAQLLDIRATLASSRQLWSLLSHFQDELPHLAAMASKLTDLPNLEDDIGRSIGPRGEVLDTASPRLAMFRSNAKLAHDRLLTRINRILNSTLGQQVAQEPIITQRQGRYVIPIKADMKGRLPGMIHDVSSSGATLFLEPLAVVDMANHWRQLQLEEEREVERIMRSLSSAVAEEADTIQQNVSALADLDLALARARYGKSMTATEPELIPFKADEPAEMKLIQARHPLLTGAVVPIDLVVGGDYSALLITGPNTGGKTVALKTAGLLTLMALSGLPIPALTGSRIPVYTSIFADIGDEQSIEQSLSTFSSHLSNVIEALSGADARSLVLLDELGAGTDPTEGSALARAILGELLERRTTIIATTHHSELKAFAQNTDGIRNASVEFDMETLSPTYHLRIGLPGRSNAISIAARLGLPAELVEEARRLLSPEQAQVEGLLAQLEADRQEAGVDRQNLEEQLRLAEEKTRALEERLARIDDEREGILASAREEARDELEGLRQRLRRVAAQMDAAILEKEWLSSLERELEEARKEIAPPKPRQAPSVTPPEKLRPGVTVLVSRFNQMGEVISPPDASGNVEVQLGSFKIKIPAAEVEIAKGRGRAQETRPSFRTERTGTPPKELHLRGMRVQDALYALEQYLNDAYLARLPVVRIVHGKGTGTMKAAVQDVLSLHPLVSSYETAEPNHGGEGVTVAEMVGD